MINLIIIYGDVDGNSDVVVDVYDNDAGVGVGGDYGGGGSSDDQMNHLQAPAVMHPIKV